LSEIHAQISLTDHVSRTHNANFELTQEATGATIGDWQLEPTNERVTEKLEGVSWMRKYNKTI
jgi:hypothetical protein